LKSQRRGSRRSTGFTERKAKEFLRSAIRVINRNLKGRSVPCGKAVSTGEMIICNDCGRIGSKALREEMLRFGFHSSATVPIKSEGRVIGVFNVYSREKDFFDKETERLVKLIRKRKDSLKR